MKTLIDYLSKRIAHAEKRIEVFKKSHGDNPGETHTYFGGWDLGCWEGKLSAYQNALDEINDFDKLLDEWAEMVFKKADEAQDKRSEIETGTYKDGYLKGYNKGLIMSTSILHLKEKKHKIKEVDT